MKIVIVGGGAGGASCAARLRRLDNGLDITILEKTNETSIASCGLPYYISDVIDDRNKMQVASPQLFKDLFDVDVLLNNEVSKINTEDKTVETVSGGVFSYDKLVLSLGAKPFVPAIKGLDKISYFTVKTLADADRIKEYIQSNRPQSVAVVGGGFIGVETAENMAHLGLKTSLIDLSVQVLDPLDTDMVCQIHGVMRENDIDLILSDGVREFTDNKVILTSGKEISADFVIMATGIAPETGIATDAGVLINTKGYIKTNEFMQTNIEDIYACGDCVEVKDFVSGRDTAIALAGPANRQGRQIADHIMKRPYAYTGTQGTGVVKVFDITAAFTGNNEKQLLAQGQVFEKMIVWGLSHAGYYPNATPLALKVLYNKEGKILGAQAVGKEGAEKRIDIIATIIRLNGSIKDLRDSELCYAPPYSSAKDVVNIAGMAIENINDGFTKPYFGTDFNDVLVVDIRPLAEFEQGNIPGSINIPAGQLRAKLSDIPKDKPIVFYCRRGYTSYVAKRIFIATGTKPAVPPIEGIDGVGYLTNDTLFELKKVPESMVIIGGGAIGSEMADAFSKMGCKCSIVHAAPHLLPNAEATAAAELEASFKKQGIKVYNSESIAKIEKDGKEIVVITQSGKKLKGEKLLVAAGRKYNFSELNLEKAGVKYGKRGIEVDKYLRTSQRHIYAVGDCNGHFLLSHAAMHQGMIALMNCLLPLPFKKDFRRFPVPWTVFTNPEVSAVGMNGEQLKEKKIKYEVIEAKYGDYGAAIAEDIPEGFVRVYASASGRIYGATIVGKNSGEMINEWTLAIQNKIRLHKIMLTMHSFPTMGFLSKRISEMWMMKRIKPDFVKKMIRKMF